MNSINHMGHKLHNVRSLCVRVNECCLAGSVRVSFRARMRVHTDKRRAERFALITHKNGEKGKSGGEEKPNHKIEWD